MRWLPRAMAHGSSRRWRPPYVLVWVALPVPRVPCLSGSVQMPRRFKVLRHRPADLEFNEISSNSWLTHAVVRNLSGKAPRGPGFSPRQSRSTGKGGAVRQILSAIGTLVFLFL